MQYLNDNVAYEFTEMMSDMNKRDSEYTKMRSDMNNIKKILTQMMSQKQNSSPDKIDSPMSKDTTTEALANKKATPLEGGHSTKKMVACGLKNMKSTHKKYMNSSSRQNSKATLIWTSRNSTTISICVSMR